ncbi:hypothetical protein EKI60_00595 [Candidatus Saccharibacteria bacterium]|nr:MAG: hypothetical protein EKI60_00595 [Candidatus Saccharibacteria bacterium]
MQPTKVSAATISPAVGVYESTSGDSICQLEEAFHNINNATRTEADCVETGPYGVNDTILLPAGTISSSLGGSGFLESQYDIILEGQGKDVSVLNNILLYFDGDAGSESITLKDFTVMGNTTFGIAGDSLQNMLVEGIEIDGQNLPINYEAAGIFATNVHSVTVRDSYIHDMHGYTGSGFESESGIAILVSDTNSNVVIERTTIDNTKTGVALGSHSSSFNITATIRNSTFANLVNDTNNGPSSLEAGTGIAAISDNGGNIIYTTANNTFYNITKAGSNPDYTGAAIFEFVEDSGGHITHTAQNNLFAADDGDNSGVVNYSRTLGSSIISPGDYTLTSSGGNVSNDTSLASFLNHTTDKHNQSSLASSLEPLADNGGQVPTIALKQGSPAIDAGTAVAGLSTDARGGSRVLGAATDSGAYEFSLANAGSNGAPNELAGKAIPGVPKTGFALLLNNPVITLLGTSLSAIILWVLSKRTKLRRFW